MLTVRAVFVFQFPTAKEAIDLWLERSHLALNYS
jgi:hypothetical protein